MENGRITGLAFFNACLRYSTLPAECPPHSFFFSLLIIRSARSFRRHPNLFSIFTTNPLLCNIFIIFEIFDLGLFHYVPFFNPLTVTPLALLPTRQANTSNFRPSPSNTTPINILDRRLDSPALLFSHSFDQSTTFGTNKYGMILECNMSGKRQC